MVDRSGNAGVQILNASDFNVRANVVRSSGRATKFEQDATGIVVYSRDASAARGTVQANRAFDPTSPPTQVHGTGTAGGVTNVVFDANVVDGNGSISHGTMLVDFPGGATLLPTPPDRWWSRRARPARCGSRPHRTPTSCTSLPTRQVAAATCSWADGPAPSPGGV